MFEKQVEKYILIRYHFPIEKYCISTVRDRKEEDISMIYIHRIVIL
jgi:hypothetical protein